MPDRVAHRLRLPSTRPVQPRSSPGCAPCRLQLAHPALLPVSLNNVPTDSHAGSVLHSSDVLLHIPPPPLPAFSPSAPRTAHAHTSADTPLPSCSIEVIFVLARLGGAAIFRRLASVHLL